MDCLSPIAVKVRDGPLEVYQKVPCGKCEACIRRRQESWYTRLRFQTDTADYSCFVTLTYNEENVPEGYNVSKDDVQLFHKRLRAQLKKPKEFKYYLTSEYGPEGGRPHYHAIYFGIGPKEYDKIEKAWSKGFVTIDSVTDGRLRYVTGYLIEKMFVPEGRADLFNLISKGLGASYLETHGKWHYDEKITLRSYVPYYGMKLALPRYYKEKLYDSLQRKAYARILSQQAEERVNKAIEEMGVDKYYSLIFARQKEFANNVKKIHKKKKLHL